MKSPMIGTTERRQGEHARIPCAIPVALTHDAGEPGFEADAVDLSAGGLSLRASSLPQVGASLHCQFETLPGGTRVSGRGEVVWAKLSGDRSGEFGLRFTQIAPEAKALISEMVAERVAQTGGAAPSEPRVATLELERVEAPITAKLARAAGRDVVFEQALDLLALGNGVTAHTDRELGRGNIVRVDLRMEGGTPMLALTVRFSEAHDDFGEYDWDEPETGTRPKSAEPNLLSPVAGGLAAGAAEPDSTAAVPLAAPSPAASGDIDTIPDLAAPLGVFEDPARAAASVGGYDEDTEPDAVPPMELPPRETLRASYRVDPARVDEAVAAQLPGQRDGLIRGAALPSTLTPHGLEPAQDENVRANDAIDLEDAADQWPDPNPRSLSLTAAGLELDAERSSDPGPDATLAESYRKSGLVRFLRIFAAIKNVLQLPLEALQRGRERAAQRLAPLLGRRGMRRTTLTATLRGVGVTRARRNVGLPLGGSKWSRGTGRLLLLAVSMLGCGLLLVYALAPSTPTEELEPHAELDGDPGAEDTETDIEAATDPELAALDAEDPSALLHGQDSPALVNAQMPASSSTAGTGLVFGHKQVPNPQRFLLRMSGPVRALEGRSDSRGFSVVIPGTLAVDPAAPIAAASDAIARARILNHGTYSELTVRFEEGKRPAYRVRAQQAGLEVLVSR